MYNRSFAQPESQLLEEADARPPVILGHGLGINNDLVGKRVRVGGGDGRNVVFVAVHDGNDLMRGFLQGLSHGASNLQNISLGSWLRERHVQRPLLPAHVFLGAPKEVRLLTLLLEELHDELAAPALLVCAVYCADQRYRPLLNERLEVDIVNGGEGEVEEVAGQRRYGGEVTVEEYRM